MTDSGTRRGAAPSDADPACPVEPELSRLERKVLEAYVAPAPPRGSVDTVMTLLFAAGEREPATLTGR